MVEWVYKLYAREKPPPEFSREIILNRAALAAAAHGRLDVLKMLINKRFYNGDRELALLKEAAKNGQLEVVKHFHRLYMTEIDRTNNTITSRAILSGNVKLLDWLLLRGHRIDSYSMSLYVGKCDHMHLLEWMHDNNIRVHEIALFEAAKRRDKDMILRLQQLGITNEYIFDPAAKSGDVEFMEWLRNLGFTPDRRAGNSAARSGSLESLEWLHRAGVEWDADVCTRTLDGDKNNLHVLKWLLKHGARWDPYICVRAAIWKRDYVIEFAIENGFHFDRKRCAKLQSRHASTN
jgi:hypothetical protein